ncbi:sensor histidine kinase [Corynebacterium oculi]|uniref:histidine kinase n=1 Tax=Corynebacterium oculi TaxID=1544416 RepID=A0A0N8W005_9CORY|nr:histidine kinase [Corynebacterium oculi]KQB85354.1 Sensor histidine kinase DesK [Corynebacterium oculi]
MILALGVLLLIIPRSPDLVLGIATLISFILYWVYYEYSAISFGYAVIFYMSYLAGERSQKISAKLWLGIMVVGYSAAALSWMGNMLDMGSIRLVVEHVMGSFILTDVFILFFWISGNNRRMVKVQRKILQERADMAGTLERTRIAREMHDIVAHSLSGVIALADGARYNAAKEPQLAVKTLETISQTSREALTQMRGLLSVLREDGQRDTRSAPGVADLSMLVGEARRNGLELTVMGLRDIPDDLPALTQFIIYRTVQELLTNMLKYSSTGTGGLTVKVENRAVVIHSRNPAKESVGENGYGLIGMGERVCAQGGTLDVKRKDGEFLVEARVTW